MKSVLVTFGLLLVAISCVTTNAYCLTLEDYYPLAQGSSWTYNNTDTDENGIITKYVESRYVSGYENVNYGGTVYNGFKVYEQNDYENKASVQILTGSGLENVKSYWSSGIYSHYQLFGTSSDTSPTGPYVVLPRYFDISDIYEVSHRGFMYLPSGDLDAIADVTDRVEVMGFEDVLLTSGQSFDDCIKVKITATESRTTGLNINRETFIYVAEGVGTVKSDTTLNWTMDGAPKFETYNSELQSSHVAPEPVSSVLFVLGGAALAVRRRMKGKA